MKLSIPCLFRSRIGAILFAILALTVSAVSSAAVYVSVEIAPPLLPVYEQPIIPGPGYIWTPGYWAWAPDGFYWVPGTWVFAPFVGALWTPGYWGWNDGLYFWHSGYWGRHVGFYGGIDYGYGYTGFGYQGGYWDRRSFWYNRRVNNVNVTNITNTYNTTVVNTPSVTRVSYSGGAGGVIARPTRQDQIAAREPHTPLLPVQAHHELAASSNRAQFAAVNNGRPAIAATPRPERFAAGPATARSFSQPAAVRSGALARSSNVVGPNPRVSNEQRLERRSALMNRGASPPQAEMRPQGPAQAQMRPQGQPRALMRPQGPPQAQVGPQGPRQPDRPQPEARVKRGAPNDRPGERQLQ